MKQIKFFLLSFVLNAFLFNLNAWCGSLPQIASEEIARRFQALQEINSLEMIDQLPFLYPGNQIKIMTQDNSPQVVANISQMIKESLCTTPTGQTICERFKNRISDKLKASMTFEQAFAYSFNLIAINTNRFSSWSSQFKMYIFVNPLELDKHEFIGSIAHELYQIVDIKNSFAGITHELKETARQGLIHRSCTVYEATLNNQIRFAASAIRAWKAERQILLEMKIENLALNKLVKENCKNQMDYAVQLIKNADQIGFSDSNATDNFNFIPNICPVRSSFDTKKHLDIIQEPLVVGTSKTVCDFLAEETISNHGNIDLDKDLDQKGQTFHGPRPKIGTRWSFFERD